MLAALLAITLQTTDLVWRPKPDDALKYEVELQMNIERETVVYRTELELHVIDVRTDGSYTMESSTSHSEIVTGKAAVKSEDTPVRRELFSPLGKRVDVDPSTLTDPLNRVLGTVCEFSPPGKPVAPGATWKSQVPVIDGRPASDSEYAFRGSTKLKSSRAWKVDYRYRELTGEPQATAQGTFLLDPIDFSVVNLTATILNVRVDQETPPATIKVKMDRLPS
jgi:hypothetical protein